MHLFAEIAIQNEGDVFAQKTCIPYNTHIIIYMDTTACFVYTNERMHRHYYTAPCAVSEMHVFA